MRYVFIRTQVIFLSIILLVTFGMLISLGSRYNIRVDLTPGKIYSIADATSKALKVMQGPIKVTAFYPHEDPARNNFELFLKQCQLAHPDFKYSFYDPHRVPSLAKAYNVQDLYTVVIQYEQKSEKIVQPTEQSFTNALVKLLHPQTMPLCFVTGHKEAALQDKERNGYFGFQELLKDNGYEPKEIVLSRDKVPQSCRVLMVAGPHQEFDPEELKIIGQTFHEGRGVLFLIDPMSAGDGQSFITFMKQFGVALGADVIVDKASRMVGGDFLVALVSQYVSQHPITAEFQQPTFFPVTRSVQPSTEVPAGIEVVPLALSSPESWAETNLDELSKGDAKFEPSFDVMGPIPVAAAVEAKLKQPVPAAVGTGSESKTNLSRSVPSAKQSSLLGRMVVIGDSDFLTNGFLRVSGNADFILNAVQWLAKDDRLIALHSRDQEFKPLKIKPAQHLSVVLIAIVGIPVFFLVIGLMTLFRRKRLS